MTEAPLAKPLLEADQPDSTVPDRVQGGERVEGDGEVLVPEATIEEATVKITTTEWEGLGTPHCPWQEGVSDRIISDPGPRDRAGLHWERERLAQRHPGGRGPHGWTALVGGLG